MFPSRPRVRMQDEDTQSGSRRKSYGKRRFGGFGRYNKRRKNLGRQALREVRQVKRALSKGTTLKSLTTQLNAVAFASNTASESTLVAMARGDTNFLREGDKIALVNVAWRFAITLNAAETNPTNGRFVLIYDKRPAGGQINYESVYNTQTPQAMLNNVSFLGENKGRFQILHDSMYTLAPNGQESVMCKGYIDLKRRPTIYDANNGDITDVQIGNLFAAFIFGNNSQNVVVDGYVRLRFVDTN